MTPGRHDVTIARRAVITVALIIAVGAVPSDVFAWHRASPEELALIASTAEHGSGLLSVPDCWEVRISDLDPSWGLAVLGGQGAESTCGNGASVIHNEGGTWREAKGPGGYLAPPVPCSPAMRVPQAIAVELGSCARTSARDQTRPRQRTPCPRVRQYGGPPDPKVYVQRISCVEAGLAPAGSEIYEGGLVEQLIGARAEGRQYEHLRRGRFSVSSYREGISARWGCVATRHRVLEPHGPFADVQLWIVCSSGRQRMEVRLMFRPTLA